MILKNRFIRSAIADHAAGGHLNEGIFELYENLAKGGVGTIITGLALVDDTEKSFDILSMVDDSFIEEYRILTNRVHAHDANILLQLVSIGSHVIGGVGRRTVLGPSAVANLNTKVVPEEMNARDIKTLQEKFARAALRAKKAGFDGIEIHAAHGFQLSQFLSPYYNRRNDIYGGPIENRARMLLETYSAIRRAVGVEYPVWVKVDSTDEFEEGTIFDDCKYVCRELAGLGADAVEISGDWKPLSKMKEIYFKKEAAAIAGESAVAVIVTGGNRDYGEMERLLNSTAVRYFGMARPFILEPDLVNRFEKEHSARTKCISCNACLDPKNDGKCILANP